jgi:MFS family permease
MLTVGQGLLTPTLVSAASHRAGAERGRYLGWQQSAGALARIVGPILATSLYEGVGVGAPYAVAAVLLVVGFVALPASGLSRSVTPA